ncbi:MAG: exonuclease SbcCD subunit D [Salinivirgaceae bacterium]|nr:exonuclease SbcCD subunit D [Salinivirgaceae bacterium]
MKIIHTSDLHIGKNVNGFSMIDEQRHVLEQICDVVRQQKPDAVLIAGDVYDKSVPSAEAVQLFDEFLTNLSESAVPDAHIFIISGNHDSPERIAFGAQIMDRQNIHLSPVYKGDVKPVIISDKGGLVAFYMLPFIKPVVVRHFFENEEINSYTDAMRLAIAKMNIDKSIRNVLICHQFVTNAVRSESEETIVGGLDNVDAQVFADFDYVALGHLHRPQSCERPAIRYSGSPLKYSFSEVNDNKTITIADIDANGGVKFDFIPTSQLHDWVDLRGTYNELTALQYYDSKPELRESYVRVTLTDENDIPDAISRLRTIYHNIMEVHYDNKRTRTNSIVVNDIDATEQKTPTELFAEFYEMQNGESSLTAEQQSFINEIMERVQNKKSE